MGERKGTNKYYPPDFDPAKHRTLNAYHGVHALRERGRKADKGIITIRFEMPYNAWCLSCKKPIGMGVRYNAEKKKVGMYHSTPIFQFSMNCAMCAGRIVMQTDPQNFDYLCIEGIRRKVQTWDPEENEQIVVPDYNERQKLSLDAMYQVEYGVKDREKAALLHPTISDLEAGRETLRDDFALNYLARKQFRETKKLQDAAIAKDDALKNRLSLKGSKVNLLPEIDEDTKTAKLMHLLNAGRTKTAVVDKHEPLIKDKELMPKRKSQDNYAYTLTKQRVTSHWLEKRSTAFGATKAADVPTTHESLSRALQAGCLRKLQSRSNDVSATEEKDTGRGSSSLVAYDDSD